MEIIATEILDKYNIGSIETYVAMSGDEEQGKIDFYKTFLIQTDYIITKTYEFATLGLEMDEDYTEVINARQFAREQVSNLTK